MPDKSIFEESKTSLEDIKAAGWVVEHSSSGGWWWIHKATRERYFLPHWVMEIERAAIEYGKRHVQNDIKAALPKPSKKTTEETP